MKNSVGAAEEISTSTNNWVKTRFTHFIEPPSNTKYCSQLATSFDICNHHIFSQQNIYKTPRDFA